jgi:hypothetical protein
LPSHGIRLTERIGAFPVTSSSFPGTMMTTQTMSAAANSDTQLVAWSRTGDRDAFRKIVERYQSLVCSITHNATGSLPPSEDLSGTAEPKRRS